MKETTKILIDKLTDVLNGKRHELYEQTSLLQADYEAWMTGDGLNEKVRQLRRREDDADFKERKNVTTQLLPRVIQNARDSFVEAFRNNNVKFYIDGTDAEQIKVKMGLFRRFDSLEEYWNNKYVNLAFTDPNAWILLQYYEERTSPWVINSKEMLMYEYVNEELQYVCFKKKDTWYIFTLDTVITCTKDDNGSFTSIQTMPADDYGNEVAATIKIKDNNGNVYNVVYSEVYPYQDAFAIQIGYITDPLIESLYVSPAEKPRPDITRLINMCSEYDINLLMHVFLQKYEYVQACTARDCNSGYMPDGTKCSNCKGTGYEPTHKSALDTLKIPLPINVTPAEMMDLSKLSHYAQLPIDVLKHQKEELMDCIKSIEVSIAGSDIFTRKDLAEAATATEVNSNVHKQNNTLYPFAVKYCQTYQFFVEKIADIFNYEIEFNYWIDKNMLRESVSTLLDRISKANASGVPSGIIADMYDEIAYVMYLNEADAMKKHELRKRLDVYYTTPLQMKVSNLAMLPLDNDIRIKSTMTEYILIEAEQRYETFYDLKPEMQDKIINDIVIQIKAQLGTTVRFNEA